MLTRLQRAASFTGQWSRVVGKPGALTAAVAQQDLAVLMHQRVAGALSLLMI